MSKWVEGRVVGKRQWTERLYSLQVEAPEVTFTAGQFGRLALPAPPGSAEEMVGRPYSFVNSPGTGPHEFYFITLPEGPLTPRLAALTVGDKICLCRAPTAFSVSRSRRPMLWCSRPALITLLSILRTPEPWEKFGRIVLVHAVRHAAELTYREVIDRIAAEHAGAFAFIPMVSREVHPGALAGRIPDAIRDGRLEARAGVALVAANSHVMLCGNPAMVEDTQRALAERGMRRHRRKEPGQITVETYW
jgi:ferredoxin--NADP+ reductase